MENLIAKFMLNLRPDYNYSSSEFLHLFGRELSENGIESIIATAYKSKVPVFCPAIVDSGYGVAFIFNRKKYGEKFRINIDQMKDFEQLVEIKARAENSGVIYIGGGVPKDLIQLTSVAISLTETGEGEKAFPHKYAIQITTDSPQWGGLSGCTFEEAISWGKESSQGKNIQCYCDATIALPLISHALNEKALKRSQPQDLSWIFESLK